jgi:hypothetical protein
MYAVLPDVYNIRTEFKLLPQPVDADEFISLRAEFEQQKALPLAQKSLIFLRNKHDIIFGHPDLSGTHFIAVIQDEFQREMLRRFEGKRDLY